MFANIQKYAKFIVAILTVLVTAGVGLIPAGYINWIQLAIALIGAVAVYAVPNATPDPAAAATQTITPSGTSTTTK